MLDHLGVGVRNFQTSRRFYELALAPLGGRVIMEFPNVAGFGYGEKPSFWISEAKEPTSSMHLAFVTQNRAGVDAFYRAALEAGGKDNGAPGLRPMYHPNYYGAFIIDPDGNNIEAVCHMPE